MEYCHRGSLACDIARRASATKPKMYNQNEILAVMKATISYCANAVERGIYHTQLTPENLFITKDGGIRVRDEISSRFSHPEESQTPTFRVNAWDSPKKVSATLNDTVDFLTVQEQPGQGDVWSLGATILNMILLEKPIGINGENGPKKI
jgi:serine/threonine protein kinase